MAIENPKPVLHAGPGPVPRAIAMLVFLSLLATPLIVRKVNGAPPTGGDTAGSQEPTPGTMKPEEAIQRYGFYLQEVSRAAKIDFTHEAPQVDKRLDNILPEIAAEGASVSVVDYDHDGWDDLYVTNSGVGSKNRLYHNNHDGTFTDVAEQVGLADLNQPGTGVCMGAVWGDYDNDGYEDVLVYKWGRPMLFHNDAGKHFTDVTDKAGMPAHLNANSAIWVDYDNDGHLDLLIAGYYPDDADLFHLKDTKMMPASFEYAENGGRKCLLRNMGDGTFKDVTAQAGLSSHCWTLAVAAADLRGTGYPDLFFADDYHTSTLYANQNGKSFKDVSKQTLYWDPLGPGPKSGMNICFGDILNQGKLAAYVSNITEPGQLTQGNNLWVPKEGTSGDRLQYQEVAKEMGVQLGGWSFGAQFGDLNNDGNLDLYATNGFYSGKRDESYWYDFGKVAGGASAIISDAANWPEMKGRSLSGYQQKCVWVGDGAGKFTEVAQMVGATDRFDGRAVALSDLFNNGALDVLVANQRGRLLLYKNTPDPKNRWIEFHLEGTRSNRSAIGAAMRLYWNGQQQLQEVSGGSGFCAQNSRRLHFGLGADPKLEKAVIRWPSGKVQTLTSAQFAADKVNEVKEPE
jgi:hypothetical protein